MYIYMYVCIYISPILYGNLSLSFKSDGSLSRFPKCRSLPILTRAVRHSARGTPAVPAPPHRTCAFAFGIFNFPICTGI